ncbi:MAG: hypothetical protein B7Z75_03565 [Acidocella sp. 20-57-95]|nr:MAG: hypothetical protein B7Z75_03565 [Acidocella sp. 20-57-95]OYV60963.1 MAG: hypothetical protein B7Z71_05385 [Acidocella sp. 21-58-7]HQT64681.1 DUF2497 domain-containing protein [Acidocella sp.]HQU04444.1 DUF2497 domain-containing protein [Acidocella sp.]
MTDPSTEPTNSGSGEPSMEEILASIRRILKDETGQTSGTADVEPDEDDVLILDSSMVAKPVDLASATSAPAPEFSGSSAPIELPQATLPPAAADEDDTIFQAAKPFAPLPETPAFDDLPKWPAPSAPSEPLNLETQPYRPAGPDAPIVTPVFGHRSASEFPAFNPAPAPAFNPPPMPDKVPDPVTNIAPPGPPVFGSRFNPNLVIPTPSAPPAMEPEPVAATPVEQPVEAPVPEAPTFQAVQMPVHPTPEPTPTIVETSMPETNNLQSPDSLISEQASAAAASAIGAMVRSITAEKSVAISRGGATIEDMVREEIRPLLKSWLDTNLPSLVERVVRAEIEKVANRSLT